MHADDADFSTWSAAVGVTASEVAREQLSLVAREGVRRCLAVLDLGVEHVATHVVLAGSREAMRPGLQRLVESALTADSIWLIRWTMGRWPRGPILVQVPLAEGDTRFQLGIVAPITGTRIALSEGPVPFPQPSVRHFKAFDAATRAPGLLGCRVKLDGQAVTALAGRWEVTPDRLPELAELNALPPEVGALMQDVLAGLRSHSKDPGGPVALEACWTPEAEPALVIELGSVPLEVFGGLVAAAIGRPSAQTLVAFSKRLTARAFYRVRLRFDGDGLSKVSALAGLPGDTGKGGW